MEQSYIYSIVQNYEEDLRKVKQKGYALYQIKKQTPELCLAAVKQNRFALQFIRDLQLREHIAHHKDLYKSSIFTPLP